MLLGGLQKLTLIDYPGKIATTVFTSGCNFRCPFCHNPELVDPSYKGTRNIVSEKEFFDFLQTRKGKLDGVCITGGEPTLQKDLLKFMKKIKEQGFLVKLDSNGSAPEVLKKAFEQGLVDYIAMDIKNSPTNYKKACVVNLDIEQIKKSVDLIRQSLVVYEFRTTVVPGIHMLEDFDEIGLWLAGCEKYVLQKYQEQRILDQNLKMKTKDKEIDLEVIKKSLKKHCKKVEIR